MLNIVIKAETNYFVDSTLFLSLVKFSYSYQGTEVYFDIVWNVFYNYV